MRLVDHISSNQTITLDRFLETPFSITIKREDLLHPLVSGNKFRKLKYNIAQALERKQDALLTFGGAYSNHIAATAAAGEISGLKTIGVIRGEELKDNFKGNPTLEFAKNCGMTFEFIPRAHYRLKETKGFLAEISAKYPSAYVLPEGGTNALAIKGCAEILTSNDSDFDYICTAVGTGGTMAGLVSAAQPHQSVIGYSALKGTFQIAEIEKYTSNSNFIIKDDYCFGGYAKIDSNLVRFMNEFREKTDILLDPIYTAKMLYGLIQDIRKGIFPKNSRILAVHTGGLQGISGMNQQLEKKNLPQIHV